MPVDHSSIKLTTQQPDGIPSDEGLQLLMNSLLRFILYEQNPETAIPGKDAAVSDEGEAVAMLHYIQDSTIEEGAQS